MGYLKEDGSQSKEFLVATPGEEVVMTLYPENFN